MLFLGYENMRHTKAKLTNKTDNSVRQHEEKLEMSPDLSGTLK